MGGPPQPRGRKGFPGQGPLSRAKGPQGPKSFPGQGRGANQEPIGPRAPAKDLPGQGPFGPRGSPAGQGPVRAKGQGPFVSGQEFPKPSAL